MNALTNELPAVREMPPCEAAASSLAVRMNGRVRRVRLIGRSGGSTEEPAELDVKRAERRGPDMTDEASEAA